MALILFNNETVAAIRTDRWKYVVQSYYRTIDVPLARLNSEALFDVRADPSEAYNLASLHPGVVSDMKARIAQAKATFEPLAVRK